MTKLRRVLQELSRTLIGAFSFHKRHSGKIPTTDRQAEFKVNEVEIPLTDLDSDTLASMADMVLEGKIETNDPLGAITMLNWAAREKRNLEKPEQ